MSRRGPRQDPWDMPQVTILAAAFCMLHKLKSQTGGGWSRRKRKQINLNLMQESDKLQKERSSEFNSKNGYEQ